jgi:hypothetical protein
MEKNFGIVYVATGDFFAKEAIRSAAQIKSLNNDLEIALFTDKSYKSEYIDYEVVIEKPLNSIKDKMMCLPRSPFYYNIFVDSDTYFIEDPSLLRTVFDYYDFACTHAPQRMSYDVEGVPKWFPEVNGGLLLYKLAGETGKFFDRWRELYEYDEERYKNDKSKWPHGLREQPTLRKALFESSLNLYILPPEYNFRTIFPNFAGAKIKMLHGRMKNWKSLADSVNLNEYPRVVCPNEQYGSFYIFNKNSRKHKIMSLVYKLINFFKI